MPASPRLKPPLTYFGGKTAIAPQIAALLPPHESYVEPFAGSLAVLLAKRPSAHETVNDLDSRLMTFWRVLRDRPADLERVCALTPHGRAEHRSAVAAPCSVPAGVPASMRSFLAAYAGNYAGIGDGDLEEARRVWVALTQGRGGHIGPRSGWRHYANPRGSAASFPAYLDAYTNRIAAAAARLSAVTLECRPALDLIAAYGQHPGVLLYCDPPYLRSVRTWSNGDGYGCEMASEDAHRELATALRAARAAVVISGYDSALYAELYEGWHRAEIPARASNGTDRQRTEVLWSNRPFPQETLFDIPGEAS